MAYTIKFLSITDKQKFIPILLNKLNQSRFTAKISETKYKILLDKVRLKLPKPYCGNHCGPCIVGNNKHRKLNYLEGLDWVSFNDMINGLLDESNLSANVFSRICIVRKGFLRRTSYFGIDGGEFFKDDNNAYEDGRVKKINTKYQSGTPGIFDYK